MVTFYTVRHNPVYNVHLVEYVLVEDLHHVVVSAVYFRRGLILGIRRDAVAAESADLMLVDHVYAAATRDDVVVLLVVGGIRWGRETIRNRRLDKRGRCVVFVRT